MAGRLKIAPELQALFDPSRGTLPAPLRDAALPHGNWNEIGRRSAVEHGTGAVSLRAPTFFPRLRANIAVLHEAHRCIASQAERGQPIGAAGEWLLDNIHLLAAQTREVHDGLPRRYYRRLPVLGGRGLAGLPRVYGIAWDYVVHGDSAFEPQTLVEFLIGYQAAQSLTLGELWALPTTLRVVLIENLRRLAERVAAEEAAREAANALCDDASLLELADASRAFEQMQRRGVGAAFALQVMQRLHADSETGSARAGRWRESVRAALAASLPDPQAALVQHQDAVAADHHSVAQAVRALQALGGADWRGIVAQASPTVRCLLGSPLFARERNDTQDHTLHAVERLARRCRRDEPEVAAALLALMRSLPQADALGADPPFEAAGYWTDGPGRPTMHAALGIAERPWPWSGTAWRRHSLPVYLGSLMLASLLLTLAFTEWAMTPGASTLAWVSCGLLAWWPASEVVSVVLHRLVSEWVAPRRPPRLALEQGLGADQRVLVVVPAMLADPAGLQALLARMEQHYLANREAWVQFALLSDWADAPQAETPTDAPLLAAAMAGVDALETRHGPGADGARRFLLLHRRRRWCESEQRWIGWERKRGKLEALVALLADATTDGSSGTSFGPPPEADFVDLGGLSRPQPGTPYLLTLDSDTRLPPGALRGLVGVAAHPLNRPRIDPHRRRVVAGHAILQPRVDVSWPARAEATPFRRLFAGRNGHDPYDAAPSEAYGDLFDEASFSGKGLLHVAAVHAVLGGRLPEQQVLSHDLIEGAIARCGGVGDVSLAEPAPTHPDAAAARGHRWTRGDWQLLPLLLQPRRFGLRAIDQWKMLDNLRRPLVAPLSLGLLGISLAGGPVSAWAALALGAAAWGMGPLLGALAGLAPSRDDVALRHFAREALTDFGRALGGTAWQIALWLRQAALNVDAIARALWRSAVSRRDLLQWTTADASQRAAAGRLRGRWPRHGAVTLFALAALGLLLGTGTPQPALAIALCLLWAGTPWWTEWAGRAPAGTGVALDAADRAYLQGVARDTWRFFEQQVGIDSHHLPPDNVQTVPRTVVAQRTSPTNIGLYLLSLACARAFGWLSRADLLARCEATLDTLDTLPRHRGHFLNWTDTQTLQTLLPAYVSTVDSGNLCVHLLALAGACDAEAVLALDGRASERARSHANELDPAGAQGTPESRVPGADGTAARLASVAARCRALAAAPEFGFLFDARRQLLHIGWRVGEQLPDPGFYDLLASEARLASLWAIAKGDLPATHWAALGRPFQAEGHEVGLRSWSGSMFEYLMPALVLDEPAGCVLERAARMAVHEQRRFGAVRQVPWGVSECAHAAVDGSLAYQYGPQGVPRLALRRTPPDELVIAPYATALAALVEPQAVADNLRRLEALGARGPWGFIEALDYTPQRQTGPTGPTCVQTTMSHHQGMTLVALTQLLLDGLPHRWCMADPQMAAVASLLHERVPREVPQVVRPLTEAALPRATAPAALEGVVWPPGAQALQPTQLLANGRYSVALRPNGAGWSRFEGSDITRWRDDALRDAQGSFVFLRREGATEPHSITQHPAPDPAAHYTARFQADRVCFEASWPDLRVRCTVRVAADDDVELRHVELWNLSALPLGLELMSMFEPCLAQARADEMHPSFAKLFIAADWDAALQALSFARQPRREGEPERHASHFVVQADAGVTALCAQADRTRWRGRLRGAWQPLAHFDAGDEASGPRTTGLDPVAALSMRLTLPPHGAAQLTLGTAAAPKRAALTALVERCRAAGWALNATEPALPRAGEWHPTAEDHIAIQTLTTALLLLQSRPTAAASFGGRGDAAVRGPTDSALGALTRSLARAFTRPPEAAALARVVVDAHAPPDLAVDSRTLWRLGLSGDHPVISVHVAHPQDLRLARALVHAFGWWTHAGVACDLVLLNAEPRSYLMPLQQELARLRDGVAAGVAPAPPGAPRLHLWHAEELSTAERDSLAQLARVRLRADGRPLAQHVAGLVAWHDAALAERDEQDRVEPADGHASATPGPAPQTHAAALGRFDPKDGRFGFETGPAQPTPRPWSNVLANPDFGALVSEAGAGYTWAGNSRLHQLTPWGNDPLEDMTGEAFYLQDLRTRAAWQIGRGPADAPQTHPVEHGLGCSTIRHLLPGPEVHATWCVDADTAIKRVRIELVNRGTRALALRVIGVLEWQLGTVFADRRAVRTWHRSLVAGGLDADLLLATQQDDRDGTGGHTAFMVLQGTGASGHDLEDWTCDRRELFDARGRRVLPDHLGRRAGSGIDPCAAASVTLHLAAGAAHSCVFVIGHASTPAAALALSAQAVAVDAVAAEGAARDHWAQLLGAVTVQSPDPLFDALVNHWLPYQTVACRLWARAGPYQAGGAYGFRDQLQDAMALAPGAPHLLREHLLRAAARQFVEGDVQHWWHPGSGAGVRTRFSDDLLWLPHAVHHYLQVSGDTAVLDETVPFLEGPPLAEDAEDAYFVPQIAAQQGTLYEHCARAIDRSLAVGKHGLPLIGGGDWNDGMNRVGPHGRGESVWLAWFLCRLVTDFAPLARSRGERPRAQRWEVAATGWRHALQNAAWDGEWFVRAFFDDGSPLGSHANAECRIDLVAQAWSVLSGAAIDSQQRRAVASATRLLADDAHGLWHLLDPPLGAARPSAGYIQAYPPGVRENGGQYAHAAVWAAMAQAELDDTDGAWRTWTWLSPAHRSAHPERGPLYGIEPYVMAADIYTQPPYVGRGGWSWYTGSAAGMHRLALESICGLQWRSASLRLRPRLPSHWPSVTLSLRLPKTSARPAVRLQLTLCAATAREDIARARTQGARLLAEGQWLSMEEANAAGHCLVICAPAKVGPRLAPTTAAGPAT
jgi:cyclic beta-1,2-glucan synthetase